MTKRVGFFLHSAMVQAAVVLLAAGCSDSQEIGDRGGGGVGGNDAGGGGEDAGAAPDAGGTDVVVNPPSNLAAYTLSYRSQVRVPSSGAIMTYDDFAEQVSRLDPLAAKRCPVSNDTQLQVAVDALGGINWTHPVEILKDRSQPPLYRGRIPPPVYINAPFAAGADAKEAAPTIERPDLVGYQENTAIFLSQRHGLLAVDTAGATPVLSCALKLPGRAKYFFYHGKEIVLLVNGMGANQAALLRFAIVTGGFKFLDAVMLNNQTIQDARLFNSTLVVYSTLYVPAVATTSPQGTPDGGSVAPPVVTTSTTATTGVKLTVVNWGTQLDLAWQEEFLNDPTNVEPFAGQDPAEVVKQLTEGQVVATTRSYKPFISASDRYFVVSRDVSKRVFTGTRSRSYTYCAESHPGPEKSATYCHPKYEKRDNPDYRDPEPSKGDYPCNGKSLLDCIQEAAPKVSKYIYVRVGETCNTYTYHDTICDRHETKTYTYPTYRTDRATQFVVYRYGDGDFIKLDEQLFQMQSPGTTTGSVPSLTFAGTPLEVSGAIDHKGDLQFQQGHFYVLTDQGQVLHTLLIAGNSITELGVQKTPRQGGTYSYSGTHSTLFSDTRMMVSRAYYDSAAPQGIRNWSDVIMMDMTAPSFPAQMNHFVMPGSSEQLILAEAGVLGPGTVDFTHMEVRRNLQKITLFDQDDASEVDNVLLGTEFNANFTQTWLGVADDQRIRLDWGSQRLFMPYSGYNHAPEANFNPAAHRLNITAVGVGTGLASEMTFDLVEDVIRTVSIASSPTAGRALAFGDSSIYVLGQGSEGWSMQVLEEYATPIAVYRISDSGDVHARIDRIGARCAISTFSGSLKAFAPTRLVSGSAIPCPEAGSPIAVGLDIVFSSSSTGWHLSQDGAAITSLTEDQVKEALTRVRNDVYCALDPAIQDGTPVPYLDEVPASVECFPWPTGTGGRQQIGVMTDRE